MLESHDFTVLTETLPRLRRSGDPGVPSEMRGLELIRNVDEVVFLDNIQPNVLSKIESLRSLRKIRFVHLEATDLKWLQPLEGLSNICQLEITGGRNLASMEGVCYLNGVRELRLDGCPQLADLSALRKLPKLNSLECYRLPKLQGLSAISGLSSLKRLTFWSGGPVGDQLDDTFVSRRQLGFEDPDFSWSDLLSPSKLEQLDLDCENLSGLRDIKLMVNLKHLAVDSPNLDNIEGLANLKKLTSLQLRGWQIKDIDTLGALPALKYLTLSDCPTLSDFSTLAKLDGLEELTIARCPHFETVDGLLRLRYLRSLVIAHCPTLANIDGLAGVSALTELRIHCCERFDNIWRIHGRDALPGRKAKRSEVKR